MKPLNSLGSQKIEERSPTTPAFHGTSLIDTFDPSAHGKTNQKNSTALMESKLTFGPGSSGRDNSSALSKDAMNFLIMGYSSENKELFAQAFVGKPKLQSKTNLGIFKTIIEEPFKTQVNFHV